LGPGTPKYCGQRIGKVGWTKATKQKRDIYKNKGGTKVHESKAGQLWKTYDD